ncbi:MAG: hypothetical protein FJ207_08220 [Gemmatimonadetes bacterium]|nr:hypothetical protein [Gemmatimonadota bacterium]
MPRRFFFLFALGAGLAACADERPTPFEPQLARVPGELGEAPPFEVYSQNVYLGGDTGPLFTLNFSDIPAVMAATNRFWQEVQQSNVPERMAAIVDEIEARRPHVVGLQEMLRFVVVQGSTPVGVLDLLALIEAEIASRGLPYVTEVVQPATSAALPLAITSTGLRALSFTDRLVVLRRSDVTLTSEASGLYAAVAPLGPVTLKRGWARVSVNHDGAPHHFVTTHLEVQALRQVQAGQAQQLLGQVLAGLDGVVVLAGDLNSDAAAQPGDVSWTDTYDRVRAAGFDDLWELAPPANLGDGFTCCQANDLRNAVSELDQRIDFVLVRPSTPLGGGHGVGRGLHRIDVVGDEAADRTAGGLWPADHAGLAASLRTTRTE